MKGLDYRYPIKVCQRCSAEYLPTNGRQLYCADCGPIVHAQKHKLTNAIWCSTYPEKIRAYSASWKKTNPWYEIVWSRTNPDARRMGAKRWRLANPERAKERLRLWRLANPEKIRATSKKHSAKRRSLGFVPLNSWFPGCEGHHINENDVIHIPKTLHRSVPHNYWTGQGMAEMNALAGQFLTEDWT